MAVLFSLLCAAPLVAAQIQQQTPPIRISVNRVNVGVTVTNSAGHFIEGLHREDFQLFDNNAEQPITDFLSIEEPAQLLLLIESGPAIALFSNNHLRAADALLTAIAPTDRVAIASYSQGPQLLLDFTPNKAQARATLQNLNFGNGFADLNLSASLARRHRLASARPRKENHRPPLHRRRHLVRIELAAHSTKIEHVRCPHSRRLSSRRFPQFGQAQRNSQPKSVPNALR